MTETPRGELPEKWSNSRGSEDDALPFGTYIDGEQFVLHGGSCCRRARGEQRLSASAPLLRASIYETLALGWDDVVLDLRKLTFMDSGGVHLLRDLRDGVLGHARFSMIDGTGPAALPLQIIGGPRLLPSAEVGTQHALL